MTCAPGLIIPANDHDTATETCGSLFIGDGIPDFADGYGGQYGTSAEGHSQSFTALSIDVSTFDSTEYDKDHYTITFAYTASNPLGITRTADGQDGYTYAPDSGGGIRLWAVGGDGIATFIEADGEYTVQQLIGMTVANSETGVVRRFYVEGVFASTGLADQHITVTLNDDGPSDTLNLTVAGVNLTAHRTGLNFGQAVSEQIEGIGDPSDFVVLVNNDEEEDPLGLRKDDEDDMAKISSDGHLDDDLMKITLSQLPSWLTSGTVQVIVLGGAPVHVFDSDGQDITRMFSGPLISQDSPCLSMDLSMLQGPLAGLKTGDVDLWFEGTGSTPQVTVLYQVQSLQAQYVVATDSVTMAIASLGFVDASCSPVESRPDVIGDALLALADGQDVTMTLDRSEFRARLQGIDASAVSSLQLQSRSQPSELVNDTLVQNSGAATSQDPFVMYFTDRESGVLTANEREQIFSALGIHALHEATVDATLTTAGGDQFVRPILLMAEHDYWKEAYDGVSSGDWKAATDAMNTAVKTGTEPADGKVAVAPGQDPTKLHIVVKHLAQVQYLCNFNKGTRVLTTDLGYPPFPSKVPVMFAPGPAAALGLVTLVRVVDEQGRDTGGCRLYAEVQNAYTSDGPDANHDYLDDFVSKHVWHSNLNTSSGGNWYIDNPVISEHFQNSEEYGRFFQMHVMLVDQAGTIMPGLDVYYGWAFLAKIDTNNMKNSRVVWKVWPDALNESHTDPTDRVGIDNVFRELQKQLEKELDK
jgi:hypothetical protein